MNTPILKIHLLASLILAFTFVSAQQEYTIYDDAPGNIKSYKPAYQTEYPIWAKMLYEYPVNYHEICEAFELSGDQNKKSPIIRYFKLWRRNMEAWVLEDGSIQLPNLDEYYLRLKAAQLKAGQSPTIDAKSVSDWTFLGPKETFWLNESGSPTPPNACPWQVNVYSFDVSASDPNILYCGTESHFVNKSIDQGNNWQMMGQNYDFGGGVTATVIHPSNPDIVYVAAGNQVHQTTDGGSSWTHMLETSSLFSADRMYIDTENPNKILAAANNGVYISMDGGENWERSWTVRAYDIQIKPDDPNQVFALTKTAGNFSIIQSSDGGFSFTADPNFPNNISEQSGGLLAASDADPNKLLVVMLSSDNTPFLYEGNTNDGSWNLIA
ncbi:MAG: hypothetical protein GQ527_11750, partial [Bacteroidales bacterium]|nr:hypothetical protein [Bacteroidales bacterium]